MDRTWGIIGVTIATALILTGCSASGTGSASSSASSRAVVAAPSAGSAAPTTASLNPSATPEPALDAQAAAILTAADQQMHTEFEQGVSLHGTSAQLAWFKTYGDGSWFIKESSAAFKNADSIFDVSNEPTDAISAWRDDSSNIAGDVQQWYLSSDASTAKVDADFAKLDADVQAIRNFH